jgi:hypothetical protein
MILKWLLCSTAGEDIADPDNVFTSQTIETKATMQNMPEKC